jgi:hypothetical protein
LYQQIKSDFDKTKEEFEAGYNQYKFLYDGFSALNKNAKVKLNIEIIFIEIFILRDLRISSKIITSTITIK